DRHNAVEVNWIDPNNGWETATELVEDTQAIARYGRNVTKMDAFGCTSRGQAHRAGLWLIKTELLETQTVDFSVGAEGLRHVPGDVIEICDDDYAGISIGGRVLAVNSQTRTLTLDREITLPSSGTTLISLVDGSGNPERYRCRIALLSPRIYRPDCQPVVPQRQLPEAVCGFRRPGRADQQLTAVIRCHGQAKQETHALHHLRRVPARQHLIFPAVCGDFGGQVLHRWRRDTIHRAALVAVKVRPVIHDGLFFRYMLHGGDGIRAVVVLTDTHAAEQALAQRRQLQPPHAVFSNAVRNTAHFHLHAVGDGLNLHADRIAAPAAPSQIELTPGYFQITATPHLAVYDPTVQFEFWFSETRITDIRQVETTARYLGTGLYWIAASINIKPGHDYYFYIRSVNTVGKSAFVEAVGRASDDAEGYLDFFKGKITESHLGKELLEKVDLTEDNASRLDEFSKEWKDANDKWNAMWAVKIEQTKDGKHYVAGIGLSMEDTEEGKLSQFLVAANRIAFIDPANGNETPMFVAQGNQIFMNDVFLKRLTAPTITSGGSPPVFSLTSDGKLTAKNADISGSVNANSGTLNNVTINENCQIKGKLSANQIEGDIVKTVSKSFPRTNSYASGTITVRISDDQKFDRQVMIPPVLFRGGKHENFNSNNQQSYWYSTCRLRVTRNGQEIFNQSTTDAQGVFSSVIDMPAGQGTLTLTFTVSSSGANNWTPTTSISDLLVVVMKKSTAGISIS
ncbi:DUF1983 domain-containing protein, partial [Escherichia coli]